MGFYETCRRNEFRGRECVTQSGCKDKRRNISSSNICDKKQSSIGATLLAKKFTLRRWNVRINLANVIVVERILPALMGYGLSSICHCCNIRMFVNKFFHIDHATYLIIPVYNVFNKCISYKAKDSGAIFIYVYIITICIITVCQLLHVKNLPINQRGRLRK